MARLRNTARHLGEFDAFYARRHFWYAQPARLRRLMGPLRDLPTGDWEGAFEYWYFERCLQQRGLEAGVRYQHVPHHLTAEEKRPGSNSPGSSLIPPAPAAAPPFLTPERAASGKFYDLVIGLDTPHAGTGEFSLVRDEADPGAIPAYLSGALNPGLVFHQPFHATRRPEWTLTEAPAATKALTEPMWRPVADAPWQPLAELPETGPPTATIYLPHPLTEDGATALLATWRRLFTQPAKLEFLHAWSPNDVTQALLSDGFNAHFLAAALLRAAEAATDEDYDPAALTAIGEEVRRRRGLPLPEPHPLTAELKPLLGEALPEFFFRHHVPWRDLYFPLLATAPDGTKTVLLPAGRLPGYDSATSQEMRLKALRLLGFRTLTIDPVAVWKDVDRAVEDLADQLKKED